MIQPHWPLTKPLSQMKTCQDWRDNGAENFCRKNGTRGYPCQRECEIAEERSVRDNFDAAMKAPIRQYATFKNETGIQPIEDFPPSCLDMQESVCKGLKTAAVVVAFVVVCGWYWWW